MIIDYEPKEENLRVFCIPLEDIDSGKHTYSQVKESTFEAVKLISESGNEKIKNSKFFIYFWEYTWYYMVWFRDTMALFTIFDKVFKKNFWDDYEIDWVLRPACPLILSYKYDKWTIIEFDEGMASEDEDETHNEYGLDMKYWIIYPRGFQNL